MRKQTIGESILQLAMTPDGAAAVIGDLEQNGVTNLQFWLAIGSSILHAISADVLIAAFRGCLAQLVFAFPLVPVYLVLYGLSIWPSQWVSVLAVLGVQISTGYWITLQPEKKPLLICLLIVAADLVLGLMKVNNASINMSFWALPLLVATVVLDRRQRRKSIA